MSQSAPRPAGRAITIGFFDGVHRGHQVLLRRVLDAAEERGLVPTAATFDLHSLEVLHGRGPMRTLLTTDEKVAALHAAGMAEVRVFHFTPDFAAQSGREFVDRVLVDEMQAAYLAVGRDFRFGHQRSCGSRDMVELAGAHGVTVEVVDLLGDDRRKISSRDIRAHLEAGRVAEAAALLGRPYHLHGTVVEGCRVGRELGFPTANLRVEARKIVPANGVYAVRAPDLAAAGVANLGVRPTVSGTGETVEVHLFGFTGDLYGRDLKVEFVARLRDEQRFPDLEALKAQIAEDCAIARRLLGV